MPRRRLLTGLVAIPGLLLAVGGAGIWLGTRPDTDTTSKVLAAAMLAAGAALVYANHLLARSLITPLEELTRSIDAARARNFEQAVPVKSNDEFGRLARTFNAMADELRACRRETDDAMRRLNRSLRDVIAAFPHPVLLLDAEDRIWVTNDAAEQFLRGLGSPNQLPEAFSRRLDAVRQTGRDFLPDSPRDTEFFRIGEREVHYLPRILRVPSPDVEIAIVLIDVSRFRWLGDGESNLVSTISHEIRTPLTSIRMILHLLLEKSCGALTPLQQEMLQASCDDCERLLDILNDLLDLSRRDGGRVPSDLQPAPAPDSPGKARAVFPADHRSGAIPLEISARVSPNRLHIRNRQLYA
jgi:signal transduction histidine kinase